MCIQHFVLALMIGLICSFSVLALDSNNCTIVRNIRENDGRIRSNPRMKFYLFTRENFENEYEIDISDPISLARSNFNSNWPVRIIIHGWKGELMSCANALVKDAYLIKGNFNFIVVDWSDWSRTLKYFQILRMYDDVLAPALAYFTYFLNRQGNIPLNDMVLIGHSIGAHIAGIAGKLISPNQYRTIFGLDPAGVGFQLHGSSKRLDANDAKYVETITTSMGTFGYEGALGHGNFYPNHGRLQSHCTLSSNSMCNHLAAVRYFAESIRTDSAFCSKKCNYTDILLRLCNNSSNEINTSDNRAIYMMGGEPPKPKLGTFYVQVNGVEPFRGVSCNI